MRPGLVPMLLLFLGLAAPAMAEPREVEVTGTGLTSQEAITQGLVQALEQVSGVSIASAQAARAEMSSSVQGDVQTTTLVQQQQSATFKLTGGYVSSYRVLSVSGAAPVTVQLAVTVELYAPTGLGNAGRRRIAVAFFSTGASRANATVDQLHDRISASLVLARKFVVVDRSQDRVYEQEMALLRSNDVPLAERVRTGQVIGADYVVIGKLRQTAGTRSDRTIQLTGEVVTSTTEGSAEVDYQVIEIATRQVKFAGSARFGGGDAVDRIGARIADEITQAIYPMRLIKFDDPAKLVINQGGDGLRPGQRFRAMMMGEAMIDPYTHESLGQVEDEVGVIEISRVDTKISYAKLVTGRLPDPRDSEVQIVLRAVLAKPSASPRVVTLPTPANAGITKLPFDR